jgi:site-specific DNA-cytosine methylase
MRARAAGRKGPAVGRRTVGDGSTYRWWLKTLDNEGYNHKILYLNSAFFGVGQSRDRWYGVFWDRRLPSPDLGHRPDSDAAVKIVILDCCFAGLATKATLPVRHAAARVPA